MEATAWLVLLLQISTPRPAAGAEGHPEQPVYFTRDLLWVRFGGSCSCADGKVSSTGRNWQIVISITTTRPDNGAGPHFTGDLQLHSSAASGLVPQKRKARQLAQ